LVPRGVSRLRSWLRAVIYRDQLEERMESELACHLEILTFAGIYSEIAAMAVLAHHSALAAANATCAIVPVPLLRRQGCARSG
jgi:hypothetical protein